MRFKPKVTTMEESKDIDSMRVNELVSFIQTYEMTLPNSHNPKDFSFKASKNEEKDIEMPYDIIHDELVHMAKRIKRAIKFNKKFYKNQEFGKGKIPNEQSSSEKGKCSSIGKKVECLTMEVWDTTLKSVLVLKISKSLCKKHGVIQILKTVLL